MAFELPINQIIQGDCLEVMRGWPDKCVGAIITDPPYGVNVAEWDKTIPCQSVLDQCLRVSDLVVWFGAAPPRCQLAVLSLTPLTSRTYVWNNTFTLTNSDGAFWQWQPIYVWGNLSGLGKDVITMASNDGATTSRLHPCQKPVKLMEKLILGVNSKLPIVDIYSGSGTTLVAAKQLGRKYIGIEISEKYVAICKERLKQEQLDLR